MEGENDSRPMYWKHRKIWFPLKKRKSESWNKRKIVSGGLCSLFLKRAELGVEGPWAGWLTGRVQGR